jgi:multidrug transporter EmrE-like cation transporter
MKATSLVLILVSVALNASAQLTLKQGTRSMGLLAHDMSSGWAVLWRATQNAWIWAGLLAYVVSVALWILVLSRVEVSYAYPMVSLGYVMAAVATRLLYDEQLSVSRMAGIAVICVGVFLVSRS